MVSAAIGRCCSSLYPNGLQLPGACFIGAHPCFSLVKVHFRGFSKRAKKLQISVLIFPLQKRSLYYTPYSGGYVGAKMRLFTKCSQLNVLNKHNVRYFLKKDKRKRTDRPVLRKIIFELFWPLRAVFCIFLICGFCTKI